MASQVLSSVSNVVEKAKTMASGESKKIAQMAAYTKDVHDDQWRITSDYGVKQTDTDHWLRVVTEDKEGPTLLEDPFAREKIHRFDHERIPGTSHHPAKL